MVLNSQLAMERELASMWELSFVVPPDHGMHAAYLPALVLYFWVLLGNGLMEWVL